MFEGFTSYYDDLLLLRSQTITRNDYLRLLGKTISGVARAPGRHKQSVAESSFDAWTRYYKQDENSPMRWSATTPRARWSRWAWTC